MARVESDVFTDAIRDGRFFPNIEAFAKACLIHDEAMAALKATNTPWLLHQIEQFQTIAQP